ncbi:MAG: lysophospholipid acyltransferase family protein [Candidatus Omnitrophica bacterium]|nr:lysophospholipid acyltransferase family protein [Candidatus Omnitrophota bacterium]MBU1995740.1 lysophospholipid acyltransferase family protein [Candidatus Omnitrophota bacterium]MBU4333362.1 lysophospholipid acyltransferase family protein [Candidatus Omnitrophota bacterium]
MIKYFLYKFGLFILYRLPISWSYKIAGFISRVQYALSVVDKKATKNNLKIILQRDHDLDRTAKEIFINFGRYLVEFFLTGKEVTRDFVKDKIQFENIEYLDKALELGKGAILVTAHIGNWELGAIAFSLLGYPINGIALPHKEKSVNDLFNKQRSEKGINIIPSNLAARRCLEALNRNEIIALPGERDFTDLGQPLEFFGKTTIIPRGAAVFSHKTGAPIIPVFLIRKNEETGNSLKNFVLSVCEPIYPQTASSNIEKDEAIKTLMNQYIKVIEKTIRRNPEQWIMFREFWVK